MRESRTVTTVVVNFNGEEHLRACLGSIGALEYPSERLETILVDNASTDASVALVAREFPWVRVLEQGENLGFAEAVDVGARAGSGELLALCNNDMRVDRAWLRELARLYDPDAGYPCVAGLILDWEGERIDFAGGFVNLHAFAGQERFGEPLATAELEDGRELPFACGGSMLVDRQLFLELGGFDPSFFALLEDVDFGWRLRLAGHHARLVVGARSFHRHGATTRTLLDEQERLFLFERNALLMLLKNIGDENLPRFLAYALFLLAARAAADAAGGGGTPPALRALDDVVGRLAEVLEERARVQSLRARSDAEVVALFGQPLLAVSTDESYLEASALLVRLLALDRIANVGQRLADPTLELRQLLDVWRDHYGVDRSAMWHLQRALAAGMPSWLRRVLQRRAADS